MTYLTPQSGCWVGGVLEYVIFGCLSVAWRMESMVNLEEDFIPV